jgi:secreted PhoX family phosphatase
MWLLVITGLQWRAEEIKVIQGSPEPSREELKEAMRYHGILYAEMDKNGEWYFVRDGKRCRLFAYAYKEK